LLSKSKALSSTSILGREGRSEEGREGERKGGKEGKLPALVLLVFPLSISKH
jgi:hypothetical protein